MSGRTSEMAEHDVNALPKASKETLQASSCSGVFSNCRRDRVLARSRVAAKCRELACHISRTVWSEDSWAALIIAAGEGALAATEARAPERAKDLSILNSKNTVRRRALKMEAILDRVSGYLVWGHTCERNDSKSSESGQTTFLAVVLTQSSVRVD